MAGSNDVTGGPDPEERTPSEMLPINFLRFNQDVTSLALSTAAGYKLYSLTSVEVLDCVHQANVPREDQVLIVERLFSSSLVAMVQRSSPRKLRVCHFKKGTEICNYSYSNKVLSVRLNRARLVVCLEESLYIHNIRDMKIMHTIKDTPPNLKGLCALSVNSDKCYLAYPGSSTTGEVQLFDAFNLQAKGMISAHEGPLAALTFNSEGTLLATASEKGTVIRVFNVEEGTKHTEFRRGVKRCAIVSSLNFSGDSRYLVLASNTETIHIFKLPENQPAASGEEDSKQIANKPALSPEDDSWMGYFSSAVSLTASYLPAQVTETFNQTRAFATITVPKVGTEGQGHSEAFPNQVAVANISRKTRVLLATSDGYLYIYDLPGDEGGECTLVKQHRISLDFSSPPDDAGATPAATSSSSSPSPIPRTRTKSYSATEETEEVDESSPAVLPITRHESHSPQLSSEDSPPPTQKF